MVTQRATHRMATIDRWQQARQQAFKAIPTAGKTIAYLGRRFRVYRNTFWPFTDSEPLVRNLRIEPGESVLDVGTGSGVIGVFACYRGAGRVVAVDINPAALHSARYNARAHGFDGIMEVRRSNLFEGVGGERFDVITANLPFRNKRAHDLVARSQWDTDFRTNRRFFREAGKHLKDDGRIYFAHSSFGHPQEVRRLARAAGFTVRVLGSACEATMGPKRFYAFLFRRARRTDMPWAS